MNVAYLINHYNNSAGGQRTSTVVEQLNGKIEISLSPLYNPLDMENKHCDLNYSVIQFLTGHLGFRKYLHRFGNDSSPSIGRTKSRKNFDRLMWLTGVDADEAEALERMCCGRSNSGETSLEPNRKRKMCWILGFYGDNTAREWLKLCWNYEGWMNAEKILFNVLKL